MTPETAFRHAPELANSETGVREARAAGSREPAWKGSSGRPWTGMLTGAGQGLWPWPFRININVMGIRSREGGHPGPPSLALSP